MRTGLLFLIVVLVGCGGPPKPEIGMDQVAGDYKAYVDETVNQASQVDMLLMQTAGSLRITIKADGTYKVVIDNPKKKDNGKLLDEGKVEIQGKSILFKPDWVLDPTMNIDQSFTTRGDVLLVPVTERKYSFTFPSKDRIIVHRI